MLTNRFKFILSILLLLLILKPAGLCAAELQSKYAVIIYEDIDDLREFNNELYMGRLRSKMRHTGDTLEEEVIAKIDYITEKVMTVLDMYPKPVKYSIEILKDEDAVKDVFKDIYRVNVNYIAFYSPGLNRVFFSADNGRLRVVAHEIGHVVVEHYFTVSPPQRIHEVMAQYAEKHITD